MALFRYKARDRAARVVEGLLEAESANAAAGQLIQGGVTPVSIVESRPEESADDVMKSFRRRFGQKKIRSQDLAVFSRQMSSLVRAGVPLVSALTGLAESSANPSMRKALKDVAEQLRSGFTLAASLRMHPEIFSNLFISIIHVGESTGRLEEAFVQLTDYIELDDKSSKQIKAATRYPIIVVGAMVIALFIINQFVLPAFVDMFESMGSELPWATRVLITLSDLTRAYWAYTAVICFFAFMVLRGYVNTKEGRLYWHRMQLKIPGFGDLLEKATIARFARSLAMAHQSGVPLIQCLSLVSKVVSNDFVAARIQAVSAAIQRGETMTRALAASELFTPLVIQMVSVGEETGMLGELLLEVARMYEDEVEYAVKRIGDLIEPILIVGVGVMVLILALGVYLPMWDMAAAAKTG